MPLQFWVRVIIIGSVLSSTNPTDDGSILRCKLPLACIPLKTCDSLLTQIKTSQNPQSQLKFLKSQVCGFQNNEPKVCCPDLVPDHKSIKKQLNESPCNPSFHCVSLVDCGPLMYLLALEKPVTKGVVKFIKTQQCGAGELYPKVCCKLEEQKENQGLVTASGGNLVAITSTERVVTSTRSPQKEAEIMNRFFNSDFLDFVVFDFW